MGGMSQMCLIAICRPYDSSMSDISMTRHMSNIESCVRWIAHMNESCIAIHAMYRTYMSDISHTWLIHMRDKTHSEVQHAAVIMRTKTDSYVWRDSITSATGLNHVCYMTHSYVQQDSFGCATYRCHYVRHDSICAACINNMCDMPQSRAQHAPITWTAWPIHISDMTHRFYEYAFRMT